ncbi:molybdenum cofactor synthesis 3 [Paraphysoderma sedebokerense]|nr:molybdenum cofactor synthesis 3 [Paraphysoderma sedebokerense]
MERINSNVHCVAYDIVFDSSNALEIIKDYDVVIDATDNVATRYLLNDACVLLEKPLVSGSALRTEGQLTVYNFQNGPCYRCLFPVPPPAEGVTNCNDGGVLGPIVGVIGSMQALEAIKIVAMNQCTSYVQRMLLFDGLNGTIRNIKLRPKQLNCCVCGENPTIKELIDYVQFCGSSAVDKSPPLQLLPPTQRISVSEYSHIRSTLTPHILLDVREQVQFGICSIEGSINIPLKDFIRNVDQSIEKMKQHLPSNNHKEGSDEIGIPPVYIFCRRGNDSQIAVKKLLESQDGKFKFSIVKDVIGGLDEWSKIVDQNFPVY